MMIKTWILALLIVPSAWSKETGKKAEVKRKIAVTSVDGSQQLQGYDEDEFDVHNQTTAGDEILPARIRDAFFFEAGITVQDLEGMDELEKDLLYLRSRKYTEANLIAKYPRIPRAKLQRLIRLETPGSQ